jgi:hypothetical protein
MRSFRILLKLASLWMLLAAAVVAPQAWTAQPPGWLAVTLHTSIVRWQLAPGLHGRVVLARAGTVVTEALATADPAGELVVDLAASGRDPQGRTALRGGDRLGLHPTGTEPVTRTLPAVTADLQAVARRLSGTALPRSALDVRVFDPRDREQWAISVTTNAAGGFALALPVAVVLRPGVWGTVTLVTAEGDRVTARWDVFTADVRLWDAAISGRATLGLPVAAVLRRGGQRKADTVTPARPVTYEPTYALTFTGGAAPVAVAPDDDLEITQAGQVRLTDRVPRLTARLDPELDRVTGIGPPAADLTVTARLADGTLLALPVRSDGLGSYLADFGGRLNLDRQTAVEASLRRGVLAYRVRGAAEHLTVTLFSPLLAGSAPPGTMISLTVISRQGGRLTGDATPDASGRFTHTLRAAGGDPVGLVPGDELIVAYDEQPALSLTVPRLAALADAGSDRVIGTAPPGTPVRVSIAGRPEIDIRTAASVTGTFVADFRGRLDIEPGTAGEVATELRPDVSAVVGWAAPRLAITLGQPVIGVRGPGAQAIAATLSRCGDVVASAQTLGAGWSGSELPTWPLQLADTAGNPVALRAGDGLAVNVSGPAIELRVPELLLTANAAADLLFGLAPPGTPLHLEMRRGPDSHAEATTTAPDGRFLVALAERWDLEVGDEVAATLTVDGGHSVAIGQTVPGLSVQLERAELSGTVLPGASVTARLVDPEGVQRASGRTVASLMGEFQLRLQRPSGAEVPPQAGDALQVQSADQVLRLPIPALTLAPAAGAAGAELVGHAAPGASVTVRSRQALCGPHDEGTTRLEAGPDGEFRVVGWPLPLLAGTMIEASVDLPPGHRFRLERRLPLLHLQHGGSLVTGRTAAGAQVGVAVRRQGLLVGGGTALADVQQAFGVIITDSRQEPFALQAADRVEVSWTGGLGPGSPPSGVVLLDVQSITATLDAASHEVRGNAPPGATVLVQPQGSGGPRGGTVLRTTSDSLGRFALELAAGAADRPLPAGASVEVGLLDAAGHHTFVRAVTPYIELVLGTAAVIARAAPLGWHRLTLSRETTELASAGARADTFGDLETILRSIDGLAVPLLSGQTLSLAEAGGRKTTLDLPQLSVTIEAVPGRVAGIGPPHGALDVLLYARGRDAVLVERVADDGGRWQIMAEELAARGLSVGLLSRVEARLRVDNGHLIIARTGGAPTPGPPAATPSPTPLRTGTATTSPPATPSATPVPERTAPAPAERLYVPWCRQVQAER